MAESLDRVTSTISNRTECSVCLDTIADACRAPCRHVFCRPCILKCLQVKPPEWSGACPLCRAHTSIYNLRDASGSLLVERELEEGLYGCVFVQGGTLGLASYHFEAPDNCYISYTNAPPSWVLDDATKVPDKKPWSEFSYDAETFTFRGVVLWEPSFAGMNRWNYEIVFSEEFVGIVGGNVEMHYVDGTTNNHPFQPPWEIGFNRALAYLRWLPPPTTVFGSVYVQGPFYHYLIEGIASYHFDAQDMCYISYSNAPADWLLDNGEAPPAKKMFSNPTFNLETRTFRGSIEWETPFNGDSLWEYEMIFSEDFGCIVAGELKAYGLDGSSRPGTSFEDPRARRRVHSDGMCYVQRPGVLGSRSRDLAKVIAAEGAC